jgi:diaminopimelate epimerase
MRIAFTKMQGAGNDVIVLDATRAPLALDAAGLRRLADRRYGVGADQVLAIDPSPAPGIDFGYRIWNGASGDEVEHCGNGARCVLRFLRTHGLADARRVVVRTLNRDLELVEESDGRVTVDMGVPDFDPASLPFDPHPEPPPRAGDAVRIEGHAVRLVSLGNPHAVLRVDDVDAAPVAGVGPAIESHPAFPRKVNVGFVQVLSRREVRLRVFERDAGETLACGTGACAAVAVGIRAGWLDAGAVDVHARGGLLTIRWDGGAADRLAMTGPAETVFEGEIDL